MVPVKNLGELRWYSGLYYERDLEAGTLTVSQQTFAEDLAQKYNVSWGSRTPMGTSVKLNEFSDGDPVITCLLYTSPSPRDGLLSRMPSSA